MKQLTLALFFFTMVACDVIIVEPAYDARNQVVGYYQVEEYSETFNDVVRYRLQIRKAADPYFVSLENFYGQGLSVKAEVNGSKLFIPFQMRDGYEIQGVGTIYSDRIKLNYQVRDTYSSNYQDFCETDAWRD